MTQATNGFPTIRVGILIENQFEDSEFQVPYTALQQAGATTVVLGTRMNEEYRGKQGKVTIAPDATLAEVRAEDFDAIVIPGGVAPDKIRVNPYALRLVADAIAQDKLVAAVCHGPQVLIDAELLQGKQITGFRAIRKDIQNAGATYVNDALVVDGNLITARQPGDLALFTTAILNRLGLTIEGTLLPDTSDRTYDWWQLAEQWGGSSRQDILNALNTAIIGERYTLAAFKQYGERVTGAEISLVLNDIVATKERHVALLEQRLHGFGERVTWQAMGSEAFATLQGWLQATTDDVSVLRRALGDLQTGTVDAYHLATQLTDPASVELLEQIANNLEQHEERLAELYRARLGKQVQPPMPTTMAAS